MTPRAVRSDINGNDEDEIEPAAWDEDESFAARTTDQSPRRDPSPPPSPQGVEPPSPLGGVIPLSEATLRAMGVWLGNTLATVRTASVPTGFARLDHELPGGGWPTGCLTEILCDTGGIGELGCVMPALARLSAAGAWQAWIAPPHPPYAPALAAYGVDLARLIVVEPSGPPSARRARSGDRQDKHGTRDTLWAIEQTLRANVCGAVLAWPHTDVGRALQYAELRRLQIAAEMSEIFAVLFRPTSAANESSPAALRILLAPAGQGRLAIHLLKRRGAAAEAPVVIDLGRHHAVGSRLPSRVAARGVPSRETIN